MGTPTAATPRGTAIHPYGHPPCCQTYIPGSSVPPCPPPIVVAVVPPVEDVVAAQDFLPVVVVPRPLVRVGEHRVGVLQFLEASVCASVAGVLVGVCHEGDAPVGRPDFRLSCRAGDAQDVIVAPGGHHEGQRGGGRGESGAGRGTGRVRGGGGCAADGLLPRRTAGRAHGRGTSGSRGSESGKGREQQVNFTELPSRGEA